MPKTKLDKYRYPKTDKVMALILERKHSMHLTLDDMAKLAGMPLSTFKTRMAQPTDSWSVQEIRTLCGRLGIPNETLKEALF